MTLAHFVFLLFFFPTGHTRVFAYYNIGLAGFFIGIGEIVGKASLPLFLQFTVYSTIGGGACTLL